MAKFCENCGAKLPEGSVFCAECGYRIPDALTAQRQQPAQPAYQQPEYHQPAQPIYQKPVQPVYPQPVQQVYQQPLYHQQQSAAKPKKSSALTVLIIVLAVILAAEGVVAGIWLPGFFSGGGLSDDVVPGALNTESAMLSLDNPKATLCGVTVEADSYNLAGGGLKASVSDKGTGVNDEGASYHEYDISLGDKSEYEAATTLTFPCDGDPDDYVITHKDHATGKWMPMISFPDEENGSLTVYTDGFSDFRAELKVDSPLFYVANKGKPNATVEVSSNYMSVLEKIDKDTFNKTTEAFAADPLNFDVETAGGGEEGSSAMKEFIVNSAGPLSEVIGNTAELDYTPVEFVLNNKTYSYTGAAFKSDLSRFMNGVTILNIGLQLTKDIKNNGLQSETTAANLMKNIATNGGTLYSMTTGYSSTAFTFTFLGVAMIGMGLDHMTDTAKSEQLAYMTKLMKIYYEKVKPFDADQWYAEFNRICRDSGSSVQTAINQVGAMLDERAGEFWTVMSQQSGKEFEDLMLEAGIKNIYSIPADKKNQLTAQVKNDFRKRFNDEVMPKIEKDIIAKQQAALYSILDEFRKPFNRELNFKVIERVDMQTVFETRYNGCSIAFGKNGNIQTGDDWVLTAPESDDNDWDDGWQEILTATDYAWMCAGLPDTTYVYLSRSDMKSGKDPLVKMKFSQPHATQSRTATINLSESATYAYRLSGVDINPNYSFGDPVKVTGSEGDIDLLYVYWEETVENNGVKTVNKYEDITACSGAMLDYPSDFVFDCYYDSKVDKPSEGSQNSSAVVRFGDKEIALKKSPYYPSGYNGHRYKGENIVPDPEDGMNIRIVVKRGVYSLVYHYESVPVDEKDILDYKIVNNCKNEITVEDYLGTWYYTEGSKTAYLTLELVGSKIKITASDEKNNDSYSASYKLENGVLKFYLKNNEVGATATLTDKDHIEYMNPKVGMLKLTRKK